MSDAAAKPELQAGSGATRVPAEVSIGQIFLEFLIIGATSFGGVVPYLRGSLWRTSIQQGLAPVTIGLLLAGCFTMAKGAIFGAETAAIAAGVLLILLQYKVNPALLVLGSAVVGVLSFMPK